MNENYVHPPMPKGVEEGILKGMYLLDVAGQGKIRAQLLGSGTILREVIGAAELLYKDFGIPADIWSVTSFNELRRDALEVERWNQLHPEAEPRRSYLEEKLQNVSGPFIAATDYMKIVSYRTRSSAGCRAASFRWARTATGAPTRARRCGSISKSTNVTSPSRR